MGYDRTPGTCGCSARRGGECLRLAHLLADLSDLVLTRHRYLGRVNQVARLDTDLDIAGRVLLFGEEEQKAQQAQESEDNRENNRPGGDLRLCSRHVASDPLRPAETG